MTEIDTPVAVAVAVGDRPVWPGTIGPAEGSPARVPGSVRRTATIDIVRPDGVAGPLVLHGRGRDIVTAADGSAQTRGRAVTTLSIDRGQVLAEVAIEPDADGAVAAAFQGVPVGRVRRTLDAVRDRLVADGSLVALLLDETPVTALISGSALARSGAFGPRRGGGATATMAGICAGWAVGGTMVRRVEEGGPHLLGEGPAAPSLLRPDDPDAWHELAPLAPFAMRRARRLDVRPADTPGGPVAVDVLHRDSYIETDGVESAVHEYGITLAVDPTTGTVLSLTVAAHVLPGPDCPNARASAQRLVGMPLEAVRHHVRAEFKGESTCTHLNDALRAVGDLHVLLPAVGHP